MPSRSLTITLSAATLAVGGAAIVPAYASPGATAAAPICTSTNPRLAARLSADIPAALRGRQGQIAVSVFDRRTTTRCNLNSAAYFQSASVIKVTILSALLRKAEEAHRALTANEKNLATAMITRSDNNAAIALWNDVGTRGIKHFLALAGMSHTQIDPSEYFGKTHITSADEITQLKVLTFNRGTVLSAGSRSYVLGLMSRVVPGQRWGTPAGTPSGINVHVKNGWVNRGDGVGWRVNSLGTFDGHGKDYQIAVLTQGDPTEVYGHATIEAVARVIHRDLNQ
jgi:beta-lactamase class A